jgi:hypothetical protein
LEKLLLQKISLLFLLFVLAVSGANIGGYGGAVNRAPLGAEAWGRGGASTAKPASSLAWWNPSLASFVEKPRFTVGGFIRPLGRVEGYLSGEGQLLSSRVGVSGLFLYRGSPKIDSLRNDQEEIINGTVSYTSLTSKLGLSYAITHSLAFGFSISWNYSKFPINSELDYSSSSALGGVSLLASYDVIAPLSLSFGVRDLFSSGNWSAESDKFTSTISDTIPASIVLGASYSLEVIGQVFRGDLDFDTYIFNSFFNALDQPFSYLKFGISWTPHKIITFRTGIRDILFNSAMFSNKDLYESEKQAKLSAGVGVTPTNDKSFADVTINYGFSNSGANAGIDHVVDFIVQF